MSGVGKYTTYAAPASDKNNFLNKIFKSKDEVVKPPSQDLVGKENEARTSVVEIAKTILVPPHQTGDMNYFPTGVDLNYATAPNLEDVKWKVAGDPANPYTPDITSPGPGKTDGTQKDVDPEIKTVDIKPTYIAGAPNTGTKSPVSLSAKIVAANLLGVPTKLGDSGGNL